MVPVHLAHVAVAVATALLPLCNAACNDFPIPASNSTVTVKMIQSIDYDISAESFFFATNPDIPNEPDVNINGWAFLLEHARSGRRVLFDMGLRQDVNNLPPAILANFDINGTYPGLVKEDVPSQLVEGGVPLDSIEAVILSHSHFDHIGDQTKMPNTTKLILGPGTLANVLPAYPINATSWNYQSDFENRTVEEITFDGPKIVGQRTHDYFGDGSFFLIDMPGHLAGHMSGLVRVTSDPPTFILLAGDAAHHVSLVRPNRDEPLPEAIAGTLPSFLQSYGGPAFDDPFMLPAPPNTSIHQFPVEAVTTLEKLQRFDAREDVWVVLAHDKSMITSIDNGSGVGIELFPAEANAWHAKGWKELTRWSYLVPGNPSNEWDNITSVDS